MDHVSTAETLLVFRNSQGIESRGTIINLSRDMIVFEVYNPYSIVQLSEVLREVRVRRGERIIYHGTAVVSNLVNTGLLLIVSATLVDPWSNLSSLAPGEVLRNEVSAFIRNWETTNSTLRSTYQCKVSNFRNFLEETSRWISQGEMEAGISNPSTPDSFKREFFADVAGRVMPKLSEFYDQLNLEARTIPPELAAVHKSFTQRELHPLVMCSPFVHRTFTKPLGYAGDFEMVNMMLRDPAEGANTYAKLVNILNLEQGASIAHRNRIKLLVKHIEHEAGAALAAGQTFRALNVGCGPAHELQQYMRETPDPGNCAFTLLDFNAETLAYARTHVEASASGVHRPQLSTIHKSIHTLLKEAIARKEPKPTELYDMVYCAGLFDYLSDKICQRLIRLFLQWTKPGGLVLTTNVHVNNPSRGLMEYLLEWHLIHRDEDGMRSLAPPNTPVTLSTDSTGINIFLCLRNTESPP